MATLPPRGRQARRPGDAVRGRQGRRPGVGARGRQGLQPWLSPPAPSGLPRTWWPCGTRTVPDHLLRAPKGRERIARAVGPGGPGHTQEMRHNPASMRPKTLLQRRMARRVKWMIAVESKGRGSASSRVGREASDSRPAHLPGVGPSLPIPHAEESFLKGLVDQAGSVGRPARGERSAICPSRNPSASPRPIRKRPPRKPPPRRRAPPRSAPGGPRPARSFPRPDRSRPERSGLAPRPGGRGDSPSVGGFDRSPGLGIRRVIHSSIATSIAERSWPPYR
jgi:hypothetical protein